MVKQRIVDALADERIHWTLTVICVVGFFLWMTEYE